MHDDDRLPIILLATHDAAAEADDHILAAALSMVIDYHVVAPLLPVTAADDEQGRAVYARLCGEEAPSTATTARVAGAMALTAASLRAIGESSYDVMVERLWSGATTLMGRAVLPGLRVVG